MEVFWYMVGSAVIGLGATFAFLAFSKKTEPNESGASIGDARIVEVRLKNGEIFYEVEWFDNIYGPPWGRWLDDSTTRYKDAGEARAVIDVIQGRREASRRVIEEASDGN